MSARTRTTGLPMAVGPLVALLALGLALRLIIAYVLLPGSGFGVDLASFRGWADDLARNGPFGFYSRPGFHDYTPGYLYILWLLGIVGRSVGDVGDLVKLPAILGDVVLAAVVYRIVGEFGGSRRAALLGAALVVVNPVTWFDSSIWGQVDSIGTIVLLLGLRELVRDHPERATALATLAAIIKPQLGILIPLAAAILLRRYLVDPLRARRAGDPAVTFDAWGVTEGRARNPLRLVSSASAGLATAILLCLPFGISILDLAAQVVTTAAEYSYVTVNAYNPWALVSQGGQGLAANGTWLADVAGVTSNGTQLTPVMIGPIPALVVGATMLLTIIVAVSVYAATRDDARTTLVCLAVLAIAFFVVPTRAHERYLFPFFALGAILAATSFRWRIAYALLAIASFANLYGILTEPFYRNPGVSDWLGLAEPIRSSLGVSLIALIHLAVFLWAIAQLRPSAIAATQEQPVAADGGAAYRALPRAGANSAAGAQGAAGAAGAAGMSLAAVEGDVGATAGSPWAWVRRSILRRPQVPDRSRALDREPSGRLDRLDLWVFVVLVIGVLTMRVFRLSEPYQMHFDEVYHARTATEFLQDWRYGEPHQIYEYTHPHLAKYAMAVGLVLAGDDKVTGTADLRQPVRDALAEPLWSDPTIADHAGGDHLYVATGASVRVYDLATRALVADLPMPGASALALESAEHRLFVGSDSGSVDTLDTTLLATGIPPQLVPLGRADIAIHRLFATPDGSAVVAADEHGRLVSLDGRDGTQKATASIQGAADLADAGTTQPTGQGASVQNTPVVAVADLTGVAFVDATTLRTINQVNLPHAATGLAATSGLDAPRIYAANGDAVADIKLNGAAGSPVSNPQIEATIPMPNETSRVSYDPSSQMIHVLGVTPDGSAPTIYVIETHANAVFADARLPFTPAAWAMDASPDFPSSDRQQILAFDAAGASASVDVGQHAFAWRLPGVIAGALMAGFLFLLGRLLFRRRSVGVLVALFSMIDGMFFVQSRIGMNDTYVGLFIVAGYFVFAGLWLGVWRSRAAFWVGLPIVGILLGLALASKWVGLYAIGGVAVLILVRSALGRTVLVLGLAGMTATLGYMAVAEALPGKSGDPLFLLLMIAITLIAVVIAVVHPIAWSLDEVRLAVAAPGAAGLVVTLAAFAVGLKQTWLAIGLGLLVLAAVAAAAFRILGSFGMGPLAPPPEPDDPILLTEPAARPPDGWLRPGWLFGIPIAWAALSLVAIPLAIYIASYIPWALNGDPKLFDNMPIVGTWPPGHTGQSLIDLTKSMYDYHNNLRASHPASSPWWAWPFNFKPVWFYQGSFADQMGGSIYDSGNLALWWLGIPAAAFVIWQAFKRRSLALALVVVALLSQWLPWSRIDRATFQYHWYTTLPFVLLAVAYFLAEVWHGPSRRTWLLVRAAAAVAMIGSPLLWLLRAPLCAFVGVDRANPGSIACGTTAGDFVLSDRIALIGVVLLAAVGVLIVQLLRLEAADRRGEEGGSRRLVGMGATAFVAGTVLVIVGSRMADTPLVTIPALRAEPIAVVIAIPLLLLGWIALTATNPRRFVAGTCWAAGMVFLVFYPNISGLPLPGVIVNAYQGLLPTWLYAFQFPVNTDAAVTVPIFGVQQAILLAAVVAAAAVVGYSAWVWRITLAERRTAATTPPSDGGPLARTPGGAG